MAVLQATRPDDPDALGLVPWPDTMSSTERIDWRGERAALSTPTRRVVPMVRAFLAQWETQRRSVADWLGRPEASWDATWGFLGWRTDVADLGGDPGAEARHEKNSAELNAGLSTPSQQSDDVPRRHGAHALEALVKTSTRSRQGRAKRSTSSVPPPPDPDQTPTPPAPDVPPELAGTQGVCGRAFKVKVRRLLEYGITEPSSRHDAVLTLAFYWAATCGRTNERALTLLEAWCKAHSHQGSQLGAKPRAFLATCLAEAAHYLVHHAAHWKFRGHGDGGGLATLTLADRVVIDASDARVRDEVAAILAWLAGRTNDDGRIGAPVQISTALLARLCGSDRRVVDGGKRRRATTIAMEELERLGVLTMAHNYVVGRRGREWSCWYQFGSGVLPTCLELTTAAWAALGPAIAPSPSPPANEAPNDAPSSPAPTVVVRVVGERAVPEGLLRVLSDGARGAPRTLLQLASDVAPSPSASSLAATVRSPWFVRMFQRRTFTPAELWEADAAKVIPFPDLEARRRMTRRQRLAQGSGSPATVIPLRPIAPDPAPSRTTDNAENRSELAAEVGDAAEALPLDLVDVVTHAWRAFRHKRDP